MEFDAAVQGGIGEDQVQGERGASVVGRVQSLQARFSSILAAALMLVVGCGMLFWYYTSTLARQTQARQAAQTAATNRAQSEMPLPALGKIETPVMPPVREVVGSCAGQGDQTQAGPSESSQEWLTPPLQPTPISEHETPRRASLGSKVDVSPQDPARLALERRLSGTVFVRELRLSSTGLSVPNSYGYGGNSASVSSTNSSLATAREFDSSTPAAGTTDQMPGGERGLPPGSGQATASAIAVTAAGMLPTQRLLLPKGAFIDCTLETAIDSTLPGMTTCITATDTFSADGKVVLLDRGTKLIGETQGQVNQGAARIFVVWNEARTPAGVRVPLASPGADELGRAGLPGKVDRHFMDRFGAAILLSVIDGAVQSAVQSSNRSGTVVFTPSGSRDVVAEVLRDTVNIRPTVIKHHGDRIQVLVARDLDFRSVYELRSLASVQR